MSGAPRRVCHPGLRTTLILVIALMPAVTGVVTMRVVVLGTFVGRRDCGERFQSGEVDAPGFVPCDRGGKIRQIDPEPRGPFASSAPFLSARLARRPGFRRLWRARPG